MLSTAPIRLVEADAGHLPVLLPLVQAFYDHFAYPFDGGRKRELLQQFLADRNAGRLWLIEIDAIPRGYLLLAFSFSLELDGRIAFVDELYIAPEGRQRGAGAEALRQLEAACQDLELRALRLETEASNERAHALYLRSGYRDPDRQLLTKPLG
ncbi:GNAT family N-acetyltransferase [Vulcanococcus limneticus]|uniref:GNAT family N-acetyltransferase n=1 Tax=Vulcanococcus limneticus TaxID=2170428 RepID=UPI00398C035B